MNDTERVIGRLEEFKEWARGEFGDIKKDLKELQHFRWKMTGVAVAASAITSVIMALFHSK